MERIDDLGIKNYKIIQNDEDFCFGMDAVLLSDFAKIKKGQSVIDLGTGTGIVPILLAAKTEAAKIVGLEIQQKSVEIATRSAAMNQLENRVQIIEGDIKNASVDFGRESFDVVTTNPPYMISQHGLENFNMTKAIARHERLCSFDDIARNASELLKHHGHFYMVHRPFRLAELIVTMNQYHLETKTIRMVHPFIDKEPNMVLIHAIKGAKKRVSVEKPLIVYEKPGEYTDEIYDIYHMEKGK